jgi:hypothetical protein
MEVPDTRLSSPFIDILWLTRTIHRLKTDARTALLTSKRTIDTNIKSRQDKLLAGGVLNPKPDDEKTCVLPLSI